MRVDDLLKLARFQVLDSRNCTEAEKDRLLGAMADEIERLHGRRYLYTCKNCAPDGLSVEEYATRPLAQVCFVCGEEARRWYTSAERVLKALLRERMRCRERDNEQRA